jgi:hypothetical protein
MMSDDEIDRLTYVRELWTYQLTLGINWREARRSQEGIAVS